MHKHLGRWTGLGILAALALAFAAAGCSAEDDSSSGGCTVEACNAHCRSIGRANGICDGNLCTCEGYLPDYGGDTTYDADYGGDVSGRTTHVTGKVWSPGGVVPISGALVYFSLIEPPAIPPGAYPETCVDPPTPFFVRSNPDGTFAIDVVSGTYRFVVQKGQFRRIRDYTVPATGPVEVPVELSTLPSRTEGDDTIPHMALVFALEGGDHIEDVLAKLQMGDVGSDNRLIQGTEQFDIYNIAPYEPNTALLNNLDRMLEYHILFFPCTVYFGYDEQLNDPTGPLSDPAVLENLRAFANAGGKIYATDMMYDIFEQPMPIYVDICGDDTVLNDGDQTAWDDSRTASGWISNGQSVDPDLSAWLDATGIGSTGLQFRQNFVWIEGLYDSLDPPPEGPHPPKTWVTGDFILDPGRTLPLTVTFPYGAGKVLFSTYHTVGDEGGSPGHPGIYPQEYVLVYLIMEIGVCTDPFL